MGFDFTVSQFKSTSCASKLGGILDRVNMELEAKLDDLVGIKAKLFRGSNM
jgi:hypothetical protein